MRSRDWKFGVVVFAVVGSLLVAGCSGTLRSAVSKSVAQNGVLSTAGGIGVAGVAAGAAAYYLAPESSNSTVDTVLGWFGYVPKSRMIPWPTNAVVSADDYALVTSPVISNRVELGSIVEVHDRRATWTTRPFPVPSAPPVQINISPSQPPVLLPVAQTNIVPSPVQPNTEGSLPPPADTPNQAGGGTFSLDGTVMRTYLVGASLSALHGTLADSFAGMTADVEISITAAPDVWAGNNGSGLADFAVTETSQPVPGGKLHASKIPATLAGGIWTVAAETSDGVTLTGTASTTNGWQGLVVSATAITASNSAWARLLTDATATGSGPLVGQVTNLPAPPIKVSAPLGSASAGDELDISNGRTISKYVRNLPGMPVTRKLNEASLGSKATFAYDELNWPKKDGNKVTDARVFIIFHEGGDLILGDFDAKAVGQTSKGLENIFGGYIQGHIPAPGTTCWLCLCSWDGKQRTNVKKLGVWK